MSGSVDVLAAIDARLLKFIATRDQRIAKTQPWSPTPLQDAFTALVSRGYVKVGGRASCGGTVDPTWTEFTLWNEVVRKAQSLGYEIEVTPVKHGNGWATKCGGFWDENEYRIGEGA